MTTTAVPFQPSNSGPFQFQANFDGATYTVAVTWNLFGRRYYVNVYTLEGDRIVTIAMVGSPLDANTSLVAGYFTTQLVWRVASGQFEIIDQ